MFKKTIALLIMVSFFYFVGATGVLASNNISVQVKTYLNNGQKNVPGVAQTGKSRGDKVSFSHPGGEYDFAFFAVNGSIREDLPSTHEFTVQSRMEITAIYHRNGSSSTLEHAVVFVDSNRQIIDVKYVTDGSTVTEPSELPTPPPFMQWAETKWLTKGASSTSSLENITSNRVYHLQYAPVAELATYALNVSLGSGSGNYAYNSVVTVTPTPQSGKAFSHWADAEGNKLSYKSTYKFSILGVTSIQAVFVDGETSPVEQPVVSMSENLGIKGEDFVTYKGQMQLPVGYSIVEYGFIFSRSSDELTLTSLGATIVPSNIHYGVTGEFMRSFPEDTFNSIRAYMIVQNGSNPEEVVYSGNYAKLLYTTSSYSTGFEGIVKGSYATGMVSIAGIDWNLSDTLVGDLANDRKNDSKSARMQASGYLETKTLQYGITNISFLTAKYGTDDNAKVYVAVSSNGTNWIDVTDAINASGIDVTSTALTPVSINLLDSSEYVLSGLSSSLGLYVKISKTGGNRINIDDVVISMKSYPNLHEVIYNNAIPSTENVLDGQTISNTAPTQTGYSFAGWYTDAALTQSYNASSPVVQSLQLYAKWTINQYTITFESAGGSEVDAITQNYDSAVDAPADPTREGYTFNGWSQAVPSVMPDGNLTLTAQWLINSYTITFDSNEGSAVSPITQNFGANVSAPTNPTREGYLFQGWFTDDLTFENEYVFTSMPSQNVTVFAKWEELVGTYYTVTFDSLGGTSVISQQVIENGYAELPNAPIKSGYTFVNWQNAENIIWAFETDEIVEDITLYAVWNIVTYNITYNNLQDTAHSNPATYNIETSTITLTPPSVRSGYNFAGWFTAVEGGSQVTQIVLGSTGNVTVYASWSEIQPIVTLLHSFNFGTSAVTGYTNPTSWTLNDSITNSNFTVNKNGAQITTSTGIHSNKGAFMVMQGKSASPAGTATANFDLGDNSIQRVTFEIAMWSSADFGRLSQLTSAKLQVKIGETWTDLIDFKSQLTATEYNLITVNLSGGTEFRFEIVQSGTGDVRIAIDNLKFYSVSNP